LQRRIWRQNADTRERRLVGPDDRSSWQRRSNGRFARPLAGDLRGPGEKGRPDEPVSNSAHDPPSLARVLPLWDRHLSWQTLTDMRVPRADRRVRERFCELFSVPKIAKIAKVAKIAKIATFLG